MKDVFDATPKLKGRARDRFDAAMKRLLRTPEPLNVAEARARFDAALARAANAEVRADPTEFQAAT
ncbi:MAG: beta-hexosaminidase, partial [Asticcacaulis sp.]|nr:beta-hexosaminidase [Asticcacaulis sp.]